MFAYAVEKAHASRRADPDDEHLPVRRNEAISEYMLEYCLRLSEVREALANCLTLKCDCDGIPVDRWEVAYKFDSDAPIEGTRNYPDIRLRCSACQAIPVLLELKLDADLTKNQKDESYWSGLENFIVVPVGRAQDNKLERVTEMVTKVLTWRGLAESLRKELGKKHPDLAELVFIVGEFAENAGWALSPELGSSTSISNVGCQRGLAASMKELTDQLGLFKALKTYTELSTGFPKAQWVATTSPTSTNTWVLQLDTPRARFPHWPFWIGFRKRDSRERVWIQLVRRDSGFVAWVPELFDSVSGWVTKAPALNQRGFAAAGDALSGIKDQLQSPAEQEAVERIIRRLSQSVSVDRQKSEENVARLRLIADTLKSLNRPVFVAEPDDSEGVVDLRDAWSSVIELHRLFAAATEGLYADKAATMLSGTVEADGALTRDEGGPWYLRQKRKVVPGLDRDAKNAPFVELRTVFGPKDSCASADLQVLLSYRLWSGGEDTVELLGRHRKLREVVEAMRAEVEKVMDDDSASLADLITESSRAILAVSIDCVGDVPATVSTPGGCIALMKKAEWQEFQETCQKVLKEFRPRIADSVGLKAEGGSLQYEPSLLVGLNEGSADLWADAARELLSKGQQQHVRVTILNWGDEGVPGQDFKCERQWVFEAKSLEALGAKLDVSDISSKALGAWCDGKLIIDQHDDDPPSPYIDRVAECLGNVEGTRNVIVGRFKED